MSGLNSSMFFDDEGIFAKTERLVLRAPIDDDLNRYIDAFGGPYPILAREYRIDERLRNFYWEGVKGPHSLYCSICLRESSAFCGYCAVEKLSLEPTELSINLLGEFQAKGIGPEAISALMRVFEEVSGRHFFKVRIEAENENSQRMFRRLGFVPAGIDTFIIKDPDELERFEDARLDSIDDSICALADEFGVEPRKLLSHVLVFEKEL